MLISYLPIIGDGEFMKLKPEKLDTVAPVAGEQWRDETGEDNFKTLGKLLTSVLDRLGNRFGTEKMPDAVFAAPGKLREETQALQTAERASHFRSETELADDIDAGAAVTRTPTKAAARRNIRMPPQRL
jgi:acetylornithine deacetylase/succinyl-diaminopimelate desuccinylase-like protein